MREDEMIDTKPVADPRIVLKVNFLAKAIKAGLRENAPGGSLAPDDAACIVAAATLLAADPNYVTFRPGDDD
jgi:hypothetical protein